MLVESLLTDEWLIKGADSKILLSAFAETGERGITATYSLMRLQERGTLFVGPGEDVYEGMVIGENARSEDLDVNPTEEKHLTNMRSSTADVLVRLQAHHRPTLDEAMEFVREDECIEVTPSSVRVRKVVLPKVQRLKTARLARK